MPRRIIVILLASIFAMALHSSVSSRAQGQAVKPEEVSQQPLLPPATSEKNQPSPPRRTAPASAERGEQIIELRKEQFELFLKKLDEDRSIVWGLKSSDLLSALLSLVTLTVAAVAVFVSVQISRKQVSISKQIADEQRAIAKQLAESQISITKQIAESQVDTNRRQIAILLHDKYFGIDHYLHVVAPTAHIRLKWKLLPESEKERYRDEVVQGWPRKFPKSSDLSRYIPLDERGDNYTEQHFQKTNTKQALTEHQSLSAFLYFWSNLSVLIREGLADTAICVELFATTYNYSREFIKELRERVRSEVADEKLLPRWIRNTESLEEVFYPDEPAAHSKTRD
jgi:hypothetical protein